MYMNVCRRKIERGREREYMCERERVSVRERKRVRQDKWLNWDPSN